MEIDMKHQLDLAYLAANDPSERNRATQRIKELLTELMERRKERRNATE